MRTKLHKALLTVGLAVLMCGFAMQASAITFSFSQSSGFSVASGTLVSTDTPLADAYNDIRWYQLNSVPLPPTGYYNTIFWGVGNNNGGLKTTNPWENSSYSALRVLGEDGNVSTGASGDWGDWVTISTVYHQNNAISSSFYTLASAIIYSELTIDSFMDPNPIPITFTETLNQAPCSGPGGLGTCPDEFGFSAIGFAPVTFSYGGGQYEVAFALDNFINSTLVCPDGINCTVWTAEGVTSSMDVVMALREVPVPEPGTLTLLGLGLLGLGLGFAKRRRKNG